MKKIIIITIAILIAFYIFKPLPNIHPQYIAIFKENVGSCYIIPPPINEDGNNAPLIVHYKGEVYGTVNLITETEDEYYVQAVNRITKRIIYIWLPKKYFKLEKVKNE